MIFLKKQYYLIFVKQVPIIHTVKKTTVTVAIYKKRDKFGRKKFYITHDIRQRHLVNWFVAKWWMLQLQIFGRKNKHLFAYKMPNGRVYLKKATA